MNDNRGTNALVMMLGICFGLYAIFSVMLTEGNSISELCRMLMVAGFLLSFLNPKLGLLIFLASSGYIDLLKRLMVVSGRITQMDLYFVLGIHPLMMAGLCGGVLVDGFTGKQPLSGWHLRRLAAAGVIMVVGGLAAGREKGWSPSAIAPEIANNAFYAVLLFIIPVLLPKLEDILKTLRLIVIVYAPVAVYGIIQQIIGFQDFEIEYLMTGLSIEIKQLYSDELRAFSTLNSPTALGFASAACFTFALLLGSHRDQQAARFRFSGMHSILLALLFVAGWLSSTARSAVIVIPVALLARYCFSNGKRTRIFYATTVSCFVLLVVSSGWILEMLPQAMTAMYELAGGQGFADQILRVGTYYERLMGFQNVLMNPAAYTLTGMGAGRGGDYADEFMNHDPLSTTLVRYGAPVTIVMIIAVALLLRQAHLSVLKLPQGVLRNTGCLLLSVPLAYLVASMLQGVVFFTFPLNAITWLCIGMVGSLSQQAKEVAKSPKAAPETILPPAQPYAAYPMIARHPGH